MSCDNDNVLIKYPAEVRQYTFDFSEQVEIAAGDTLAGTATIVIEMITGDAAVSLVSSSVSIATPYVHTILSGGVEGERYRVECQVTTTAGRTLGAVGILKIKRV